ncbi:MAG: linear amide C-N hydrolase [Tissierellia bacterium]|nr:linear amide C-N hydrolase [Tissierellia bacterium]
MGMEFKDELAGIKSVQNLVKPDDSRSYPLYRIDIAGNYYMDAFYERGGAVSSYDLAAFLTDQLSRGYYHEGGISLEGTGCSSFTCQTNQGDRIFARNYDMDVESPLAVVFTSPDDGRYRSISVVNLEYLGFNEKGISSFNDKLVSLAGVYLPMDGMNEKGLAISIHMSYQGPGEETIATDMDTGKFDVTSTSMVRLILDNASSVEEAVDIAKNIDLHDDIGNSFHYIVADVSGQTAVLQWVKGKDSQDTDGSKRQLEVIYQDDENAYISSKNYRILTNFITLDGYNDTEIMAGKDRFNILEENLSKRDGLLKDENQAMNILSKVAANREGVSDYVYTLYSAVYNLSDKTLDLVVNENYDDSEMTFHFDLAE